MIPERLRASGQDCAIRDTVNHSHDRTRRRREDWFAKAAVLLRVLPTPLKGAPFKLHHEVHPPALIRIETSESITVSLFAPPQHDPLTLHREPEVNDARLALSR
jgi:hypothetical protein